MRFVRRSFSASWDESRFAFTLAPSLTKNISPTKIPANKSRQIGAWGTHFPGDVRFAKSNCRSFDYAQDDIKMDRFVLSQV